MSIYVLTVDNEEDNFDMYFSTHDKAEKFVINNFSYDTPRKISNDYFEGKNNRYVINDRAIDQERF